MSRRLLLVLAFAAIAGLAVTCAEPLAPTASVDGVGQTLGRGTPMQVTARDRGSGLAQVEVRLVPEDGSAPLVLARQDFPRRGWFGSGVHEATLTPTLGDNVPVPEGKATLEVAVADHSWLSAVRWGPRAAQEVLVDVTPPALTLLSRNHTAQPGGSEMAVFKVGSDAVTSGVQVGDTLFPATEGLFRDAQLRAALFALPDDGRAVTPTAVAVDAAGNRSEESLGITLPPRTFAAKKLAIGDAFLQRKVPELLTANALPTEGSLVDGYLRINRELRETTEARVRELTKDGTAAPLWSEHFVRMPGSTLSGFADRRTYTRNGTEIDRQTHYGYDIASLKQAPVPATNTGVVVFAGPLGIYGNTVILDHGLGLHSLYGHLSEIVPKVGESVERGLPVGKTGDTGLAGGDHLHVSMLVRGQHVDPAEWWDRQWMGDHVLGRLADHPRAVPPTSESEPEPAT